MPTVTHIIDKNLPVYATGNQTISGVKTFIGNHFISGNTTITGNLTVSNNLNLKTINSNTTFGIYNYFIDENNESKYLQQAVDLNNTSINDIPTIADGNIVNLCFGSPESGVGLTYKVTPGILVNYGNEQGRNLIKFSDNSIYSGKAVRKIRYNSTIGNGYERFNLTSNSSSVENCPIIKPKTRRLETFYDISVPSGGGTRFIVFRVPTSFPFVQGTCMNLRFSFEADDNPCIISGVRYGTSEPIFSITGANYNFIQKERVILIHTGQSTASEFKLW
jgi:hypothetical protein